MPELPECEANRRRVADQCLNRTIEAVRPGNDTTHVELPTAAERERFVGTQFTRTHRHGKLIFAGSASGPWIGVHLGMTGSLRPYEADGEAPDYARITFVFEGDRRLAFRCPRKLGWVRVCDAPDDLVADRGMGPDAMEIGREEFRDRLGTRGTLKPALLNQSKLAGIGNLWSDEIAFQMGLAPDAPLSDLDADGWNRLYDTMRDVLGGVLDTNATYSELPQDWLIHHRKAGTVCPRCKGEIAKKSVGGRTAYYCKRHQGVD